MFLNKKVSLGFILLILVIALVAINTVYSANNAFVFNKNLTLGNVNNDVKELQKYLNNNGFILASTGAGSKGKETTYFGPVTKKALIKFQQANKIKPSVGYFGPLTRDFINKKNKIVNNQMPVNNNNQSNNTNNNSNNNSTGYTIGGSITGLGGPVTIQNNNNQDVITINPGASSEFTFPTKLNTNTNYTVTIKQNYLGQACYIKDNVGVVTNFNITNIKIACGINLLFNPFTHISNSSSPVYTLSYAAGANGSISGSTSQTITLNNNASTVTATPNTGYHFTTWSDGVLTASRTDNNIINNISVTASFEINTYTLTSSAGANGTITATDTVNYGSNKTFTITPNEGYLISDVLVDSVSVGTDSTYTFTNVTANHTISATFAVSFVCGTSTVSYDGQTYSTVSIGSQCWFAENLNIGTKVNSGSSETACHDISGDDSGIWSCQVNNSAIEKYCYGDDSANCTTDGGLYEWAEALQLPYDCNNSTSVANEDGTYTLTCPTSGTKTISATQQGICPTGWHVPSFNEYQTLAQVSDPSCELDCDNGACSCSTAGDKLKATVSHTPIAWDGSDIYNYSALPSGYRGTDGSFGNRGDYALLWSSVPYSGGPLSAWYVYFTTGDPTAGGLSNYRASGFSVRCIKD